MKIIAIMGGGDWADASVDHLILPKGVCVDDEHRCYRAFLQGLPPAGDERYKTYKTFTEFLISRGAIKPSEDQLEELWEP